MGKKGPRLRTADGRRGSKLNDTVATEAVLTDPSHRRPITPVDTLQ